MRKLLNTVYVTTEGTALKKDGETLVAEVDGAEKARVPLHMLASVVTFGAVGRLWLGGYEAEIEAAREAIHAALAGLSGR